MSPTPTNRQRKPAQPMEMPKISVVETDKQALRQLLEGRPEVDGDADNPYGSLQILEPTNDQSFWGTGGTVVVRLRAGRPLSEGHKVNYFMDGAKAGSTSSLMQLFADVVRGEHQLRAEIVDENGVVLTSSDSVTFHMKQQSKLNPNNPANSPRPT